MVRGVTTLNLNKLALGYVLFWKSKLLSAPFLWVKSYSAKDSSFGDDIVLSIKFIFTSET